MLDFNLLDKRLKKLREALIQIQALLLAIKISNFFLPSVLNKQLLKA